MDLISINSQLSAFEKQNSDVKIQLKAYDKSTYEAVISGNIDTYNSEHARKQLEICLQADELKKLVCNLEAVNYVSSTGVGLFTSLLKICNEKKLKIYLMNLQPKISDVFDLLGFSQFFNMVETIEEVNKNVEVKSIFPVALKCPSCGASLKVPRSGRFRCNSCKKGVTVHDDARIELTQGDIGA